MSEVYWGTSRDSRYSGTRRSIGALGAPRGVGGCLGASEGVGVSGVCLGLAGTLGTQGPEGVYGHWGLLGV